MRSVKTMRIEYGHNSYVYTEPNWAPVVHGGGRWRAWRDEFNRWYRVRTVTWGFRLAGRCAEVYGEK